MFKVAYISSVDGLKEARGLLKQIYDENPKHWPAGLTPEHFDGGLYLIREASTKQAVGFCGWQERDEVKALKQGQLKESGSALSPAWDNMFKSLGCRHTKVGYYSIGILPQFRNNGFAKEALQKLIRAKSAGVDQVKALIMASNKPSLALADSLGVEKVVKRASSWFPRLGQREERTWTPEILAGAGAASFPGMSLYQYVNKDLPAINAFLDKTPIRTWSTLRKHVRPGDIMFNGALNQGDATLFGRLAHGAQGVNPYHAFTVGSGRNVFHGGGEHGFTDAFGRRMRPFVEEDLKPRDLLDRKFWGRTTKAWEKGDKEFSRYNRRLGSEQYRKKFWERLGAHFADSTDDVVLATRLKGVPMTAGTAADLSRIMDLMNARPYGTAKAMRAGLTNVLFPRFMRGRDLSAHNFQNTLASLLRQPGLAARGQNICIPGTSSCGELPATLLKRLGQWNMNPASTLPSDLLSSGKLKSIGMAIPNTKMTAGQARQAIMKAMGHAANVRISGGLAGMAGMGALGAGLFSLRRLKEPKRQWGF